MSDALVSVVVPVYNGERYLAQALDSILSQTYPRLEVLVVDDGSTDGTPDLLASYGGWLRVLRHPSNRGIYEAANSGIAETAGEFVAVYHADDVYLPTIVEREAGYLRRHPEVGAVFCLDILVDAENREYDRLVLPPELRGERPLSFPVVLNALLCHKNRFLRCPGAMVRASVYRELGVYRQDRYRNNADLDMWLRIARRHPLAILEEHLFRYRHTETQSYRRYQRLRTDPERFFTIVDDHLWEGGSGAATSPALRAYEAYRVQDAIRRAANAYVLGDLALARRILGEARTGRLWVAAPHLSPLRLSLLLWGLRAVTRAPRSTRLAALLGRRGYPATPATS